MQINTGEGKSITNPMLAAMQYLEGYAVNVFTSNTLLATRDKEEATNFWAYLGIPTSFIAKNSPSSAYLERGINYTTPADFALYSAAVGNQTVAMAGVYDESDLAFYETNTDFNFSDSVDKENLDPYKNPYDWVYPLINDFIAKDPQYNTLINRLAKATDEHEKQIISNQIEALLRINLNAKADQQQRKLIDKVDGNRLLRWLAAAESIKKLEPGKDYTIRDMERDEFGEKRTYRKICLLDGEGHEIEGAILANGAHQFLSARLQEEDKTKGITGKAPFVIDQESFCVSSRNAHTELLRMSKIVGITGTMGHDELLEEFRKHHETTAIKIPPHNLNKRHDLLPRFANDHQSHVKLIKKELKKSISESQLLIGADAKQCETLLEDLKEFAKANKTTLILATASGYTQYKWDGKGWKEKQLSDDPNAPEESSVFQQAAQLRTITISTAILGRGVNISCKAKGLSLKKVIKAAFDPNARLEGQVEGRTGRYGAEGTTVGIYDWQHICETQHLGAAQAATKTDKGRREILVDVRRRAQAEEVKRLHLSAKIKEISVQYQDYFDAAIKAADTPAKKESLLLAKLSLIEKLETLKAKIPPGQTDEDVQIEAFRQGAKKSWDEIVKIQPELLKAATEVEAEKKQKQTKKGSAGHYGIQASYSVSVGGVTDKLVAEYQSRNQRIYDTNQTPKKLDDKEIVVILKQFDSDLTDIYQNIGKSRRFPPRNTIATNNIQSVIEKYINPYLVFTGNWSKQNVNLSQGATNVLRDHIKNITLSSDTSHRYLHYICRAKLVADQRQIQIGSRREPVKLDYNLENLTVADKKEIFESLKTYIETLPKEEKQSILDSITKNQPTGDITVDYYTTLIKKERGMLHINKFGNTGTFKQLIEYATGEKKELEQEKKPELSMSMRNS